MKALIVSPGGDANTRGYFGFVSITQVRNSRVRNNIKDGSSLLHPFPNSTEHDIFHQNDKTVVNL